jgi:hypothetical protein
VRRAVFFASTLFVILASLTVVACDGEAPAGDAGGGIDAGTPPGDEDAGASADGGPLTIADAGACDTWGIDGEGDAITGLTAGSWTFVPFPEAHCMNGTSTGIGVNLSPSGTQRLLIFLEGGGACFDAITCSGVAGASGFGSANLAGASGQLDNYGIFRRADEDNPLRDWTFVYVPYCTGDAHAGTNPDGYEGREQVGFLNVQAYLRRLVPTFRDSEMVLLAGSSAGGLGAFANFDQVQHAFGCAPVHMLDDSGPVLGDEYLRPCLQNIARELWGLTPPADCPQCAQEDGGGLSVLWSYLAQKYPDRRFGFLSTTADRTFRTFFGYGLSPRCNFPQSMSAEMFEEGIVELRDAIVSPYSNVHTFYVRSDGHTFLPFDLTRSMAGGLTVGAWITQLVEDDPAWTNVGP